MKAKVMQIAMMLTTLLVAARANAKFYPGASGTFYVTNVDECQYYPGEMNSPTAYIGVYFSANGPSYDPNENTRAYLWVDHCTGESARGLIGRELTLKLGDPRPSNWDPTIVNYSSLDEMLNATTDNSIQFDNAQSSVNSLVKVTFSGYGTSELNETNELLEQYGNRELKFDGTKLTMSFINSRGSVAFVQTLTLEEYLKFMTTIQHVMRGCTADALVQSSPPQVLSITTRCQSVDLSMRNVPPNAG